MTQTRDEDRAAIDAVIDTEERSNRVYCQQDLWYFRTREGKEIGPFRYRSEAESNLDRFMADLKAKLQPDC